jgi:subtilisin family serine protease
VIAKIFGKKYIPSNDVLAEAIGWAHERGAHIVSLSLGVDFGGIVTQQMGEGVSVEVAVDHAIGAYRTNLRLFDALASMCRVRRIDGHGCLLVAAAGNASERPEVRVSAGLPAASDGYISVAAVESDGPPHDRFHVAGFSSAEPTICAPGVNIVSAGPEGGLGTMTGTSAAAPHVAGVLALWIECLFRSTNDIDRSVSEAATRLVGTANRSAFPDGGDPRDIGAGMVVAPD